MALGRLTLGQILIRHGFLSEEQLAVALQEQTHTGMRLGETLLRMGLLSDAAIARALAEQLDMDFVDLDETPPSPDCIISIPREVALEFGALPVRMHLQRLMVAVRDPYDIRVDAAVREASGLPVKLVVAPETQLRDALIRHYGTPDEEPEPEPTKQGQEFDEGSEALLTLEQVTAAGQEIPVIRLVNALFADGVRRGASDIHIEPMENGVRVRLRIDGRLRTVVTTRLRQHLAVTARIKVMCGMDISENRKPQDGGCQFKVDGVTYDLRISTLPSVYGETIVIRVLKNSRNLLKLDDLGFDARMLHDFRRLLSQREGVVLVTGPTGSGKTTTLYGALDFIISDELNVITVEDPVEVKLPGVTQVHVNERAGRTYAATLRAMLRQDPDVLMVGEIRDAETADMACRAALTGHLVLSTLHTRDSIGSLSRLMDMGVPKHVICASLNGALAQRLIQRNCPNCSEDYMPPANLYRAIERVFGSLAGVKFRRGTGCPSCGRLGTRGRLGVYELFPVDESVRTMISAGESTERIREHAKVRGFQSMEDAAFQHVIAGRVPPEELEALGMRVAMSKDGHLGMNAEETAPPPVAPPLHSNGFLLAGINGTR